MGMEEERVVRVGIRKEQVEREAGNQEMLKIILKRLEREKKEEIHQKINGSKYNINYKMIIKEKFPNYLEKRKKIDVL